MGGGHGIGIKRNDYRRRNRRRNISTHSRKHGYNRQSNQEISHSEILAKVEVVKLSQSEIIKKAKENWAKVRQSNDYQTRNASIQLICFTYVRHHLTNYDDLRRPTSKDGLSSDSYLYVLQRVCNAIAETYPWLAKECRKHYEEKANRKLSKRELRVIKRPQTLTQLQLEEYNAREEERWKGILQQFAEEESAEEVNLTEVLTSLASERTLYFPPFLKPEEIKRRRFGSGMNNNDRWWEWEEELGKKATAGRPLEVKEKDE